MKYNKRVWSLILAVILIFSLFAGCAGSPKGKNVENVKDDPSALSQSPAEGSDSSQPSSEEGLVTSETMSLDAIPLVEGQNSYEMPKTSAPGTLTESNAKAIIDYSNTSDGYIMIRYLGTNKKVKVIITGPSGVGYTYNLSLNGEYDVFPLSDGNGSYKAVVYENISGTKYSTALSCSINVSLKDEFAPFIRSNKYVNFTDKSKTVAKAEELTKNSKTATDKIKNVYEYVIKNVKYDYELAKTVKSGYIPDVDSVLASGKGICFDYAALMTAMLRSRGVPTKLVVGYTGSVYHAWISTYSEESGWVEASIFFDGKQWKLMDPTFASNGNSSKEIMDYIGNGANYSAKYLY